MLRASINVALICAAKFCVAAPALANSEDVPLMYTELQGLPYAKARHYLLAHGNKPLDFRNEPGRCEFDGDLCKYKDFESCFVDNPTCVFVWKAKDGRFLHVQTVDPHFKRGAPIDLIAKERDE